MNSDYPVGLISRRSFIVGASALMLSACGGGEGIADSAASAAKGDHRQDFVESLAWMTGPRTFSVAFSPYRLSDDDRRAVLASQTLYPTLDRKVPMLNMKVETSGDEFTPEAVKSVELIFWHYDPVPTVIREEIAGRGETAMTFANLSGSVRKGGFAIGSVRGQKVVESRTMERPAIFTWNLGFQVSIV